MLRLNTLSRDLFDGNKVSKNDTKVTAGDKTLSRNWIVASGRVVACEYFGRGLSEMPETKEKYLSLCEAQDTDYNTLAEAHRRSKFLYCAALADQAVGRTAPASYEEAVKNEGNYRANEMFFKVWNSIDVDILNPIFPTVFEDVGSRGLMQIVRVPLGSTYELTIPSNDVFLFEDGAHGSQRSTTKNYLYAKNVTLNPKVYTCNFTIKWYQDIVNGDAGRYYAALMGGFWNKAYAMFMQTLTAAAATGTYIPTGLRATTYNSTNWINLTTLVAAANGGQRDDLIAFGTPAALSQVLPVDNNGNPITGLTYGLGEEWFRRGYLPNSGGVSLVEVMPVIVPGTQNSSLDTISLGNDIYIAMRAGRGYAPIYCAIAEGTPMTLSASIVDTADMTVDVNATAMMDVKPVFASKIGIIEG